MDERKWKGLVDEARKRADTTGERQSVVGLHSDYAGDTWWCVVAAERKEPLKRDRKQR